MSYPVDQGFPYDNEYFNIQELVTGSPSSVPYNFNDSNENKKNINLFGSNKFKKNISENSGNPSVFNLLNIPKEYIKPNYSWGKEKIRHSWGKKKLLRKSILR